MNKNVLAWPLPLRLLHWLSAALVFGALGLGVYMVQLVPDPALRFGLTQTHKNLGIAILAFSVVRLCLRIAVSRPLSEISATGLIRAAKATHIALYALLLLTPLSGWLMASTSPVRVPTFLFALFELPYLLEPDFLIYKVAHAIHVAAAIALGCVVGLHVAAALMHALWLRDRTLARMWGTGD
jgi:cytochrome b561